MSGWTDLGWRLLLPTPTVAHDVKQTANLTPISLVFFYRFIDLLDKLSHELVAESFPHVLLGQFASFFIIDALFLSFLPALSADLSRIAIFVCCHLEFHIFINVILLFNSIRRSWALLLGVHPIKTSRLRIIRNLCHFVEKGQIVLILRFFIEKDIGFLKFITLSMSLNSQQESFSQPIEQRICNEFTRIALWNERFYHVRKSLINNRIFHQQELSVWNRLNLHQLDEVGNNALILSISVCATWDRTGHVTFLHKQIWVKYYCFKNIHIVNIVYFNFEGQFHELIVKSSDEGELSFDWLDDPARHQEVVVEEIRIADGIRVEQLSRSMILELIQTLQILRCHQFSIDILVAILLLVSVVILFH